MEKVVLNHSLGRLKGEEGCSGLPQHVQTDHQTSLAFGHMVICNLTQPPGLEAISVLERRLVEDPNLSPRT